MTIISDTIYMRDTSGRLRYWYAEVEGACWRGHDGLVGGKEKHGDWTRCTAKSQATPEEQAQFEADAEYQKKLKRNYRRTEAELDSVPPAVMLCKPWKDTVIKFHRPDYIKVQPKLDGYRMVVRLEQVAPDDFDVVLRTRDYQEYGPAVDHIREALRPVFTAYPDLVLDGEVYNHTLKHDFNTIQSLIKKETLTGFERADCQRLLQYHVYDAPHPAMTFNQRSTTVHELLVQRFDMSLEPVVVVPTYGADSLTEIDDIYVQVLEDGYEGLIIRSDEPYQYGIRTPYCVKRKEFVDEEFPVMRLIEGNGAYTGCAKAVEFMMPGDRRTEKGERPKAGIKGDKDYCRRLLAGPVPKIVTVRYLVLTPGGIPRGPVAIEFDRVG